MNPLEPTVLWLTMRQLFAKRRIWLAVLFALVPVILTFFVRFMADDRAGSVAHIFSAVNENLILGTLLPLAAAVFGTTAFGGEVDDGTLIYLLVKPIARYRVVLSKYVVALISTLVVIIPSMVLTYLLVSGTEVGPSALEGYIAGAALGGAVYCALFLLLGLVSKRALVLSLLYVIAFEGVLSRQLVGLKSLSVREFSVAASIAAGVARSSPLDYLVPMNTVWIMSAIFAIGSVGYALLRLSRYELAERV